MASGSKQPTVEDYFSDDSAHGNEGIEDHSASSPDSRRAPLPTSQPSDPRSDSGYASYTDATYRKSQNIVHNEISSTEEYPREEKGNSQRRPREVIAKPAQLPKQRLPTIVHSESVPEVIIGNRARRPRETAYHTEPSHGIAGRRSIPAALSSPDITQGARDMSINRPSIRLGSYQGRPEIEINIQSARNSQSDRAKEYRIEPQEMKRRPSVIHDSNNKYSDQVYADQSYRKIIPGYPGKFSEPGIPRRNTYTGRLQYAEYDDELLPQLDKSAPITLDYENPEDRHFEYVTGQFGGVARIVGRRRNTGKSYIRDKRKRYIRDDQQIGIPNQSQIAVTQDDGEVVDDTSNAKTVTRTTGARCEGSAIDSQLGTQDGTDDDTERHILRNEVENIETDWKDVWNMIPEVWKWDLEHHTIHRADGTRHGCWTCTPIESDEPKLYPLTIASAPVVLPVEYQWPPAAGLNPPPDPRPSTPIDCSRELPLDTIRDLFLTFEGSVGFYILISGLIQVIVPDDFDLVRGNQFSSPLVLYRSILLECFHSDGEVYVLEYSTSRSLLDC
jgi:hypothetical protein